MEKDFDFQAGLYFQNNFFVNLYEFTIAFDVLTESLNEQFIALERIKYIIYEQFENSVFVCEQEQDIIKKYTESNLRVCSVPEEPYDQIIALILLLKINSICEGKLFVSDIKLKSRLSDDVRFFESIETANNSIREEGWWNKGLPSINSNTEIKNGKVVKLVKDPWLELGLSWKDKKTKTNEVIFTGTTETKNQNS